MDSRAGGAAMTGQQKAYVLACRTALAKGDIDEAYHQLYWFAESFSDDPYKPWKAFEREAQP